MNDKAEIRKYKEEWKKTGALLNKFSSFMHSASNKFIIGFTVVCVVDIVAGLLFFGSSYAHDLELLANKSYLEGLIYLMIDLSITGFLITIPMFIFLLTILFNRLKSK